MLPTVVAIAPDGAVYVGERAIEIEPHLTLKSDGASIAIGFSGGEWAR